MFDWSVRVYFEDTDSGGVVYHSNYLKFMERARTEWLRSLGIDQIKLKQIEQVMFVVSKHSLKYIKPARFNDMLTIKTNTIAIKNFSLWLNQKIFREDTLLLDAEVEIACIDAKLFKPKKIPPSIKKQMEFV
jgi:acyl-CoA thioester hydrolase